ncbi:DUF6912 family protein [Actinospica robiniae]|uniref:DUF6912 family protein n=1 Tax=Actinospica robiniae TaxID=304901 RepID=UPI00040777CC|nr:hypothetical protein [Actinospica robiniae]
MRVYLPGTIALLEQLEKERTVPAGRAYAVTEALRAWYLEGDEEELEYAALTAAARASLRLLAADPALPDARALRVVLAADVPEARIRAGAAESEDPGVIDITEPVRLKDIASLHVDEAAAREAVRAALAALAADPAEGDPEAELAVDAVEDFDLLWYGVQELGQLT